MTTHILYHKADWDGKCSAAIILKFLEYHGTVRTSDGTTLQFDSSYALHPVDYGDDPVRMISEWEAAHSDTNARYTNRIVIVDWSPSVDAMAKLMAMFDNHLIWIDHHDSAIELLSGFAVWGKREVGKAGCELTWEFFFPNDPMPQAVKYLGRYDVFDQSDSIKWSHRILPFQYGMRLRSNAFALIGCAANWDTLLSSAGEPLVEVIIVEGHTVLGYVASNNKTLAETLAFRGKFEGYNAVFLNRQPGNSQMFGSVFREGDDIMVAFGLVPSPEGLPTGGPRWRVSLYSESVDVDVSKIAQKYGGGGHANAAGFATRTLPFEWAGPFRKEDPPE